MKNILKLFFIVAFITTVGFSFIACEQEKENCNCSVTIDPSGRPTGTMVICEKANCLVNIIRTSPPNVFWHQYANQTVTCDCN